MFRYLTGIAGPALAVALVLSACSTGDEDAAPAASVADASVPGEASAESQTLKIDVEQSITLTSPVFHEKRRISKNYSCTRLSANDPNISPPLASEGVPEEAKSIALIMHSTETVATDEPWIHWVIWNIPVDLGEFSEGVPQTEELPDGSRQGVNSGATIGYVGPCPPEFILVSAAQSSASGKMEPITSKTGTPEKYFFDLYALDAVLDLAPGATSEELLQAMEGHVLARGELVGEQLGKFLIKHN